MAAQAENLPGVTPSKGTIRIAQVLSSGRGANSGLHLHPQGHRLVSAWCGSNAMVDFWAVDTAQHLQSFEIDVELADVGIQPPPDYLPPGADSRLDAWPAHILPIVDTAMNALGGHFALAAGRGARVYRFSADEGQLIHVQNLRGHEQAVGRIALDSSGERAITADGSGQVVVWSIPHGRSQHVLRISTMPTSVSFIWNNMLALAGDAQGRIVCWELEQGRRHLQFQAHHGVVSRTAFNNDSGLLLTVGGDNSSRMWNLEEGKQIGRDMRHRSQICDAAFAYAGRFVVTCGADGHVAVWNSTDGDLLDWYFDSAPVYRVAFDKLSGTLFVAGARTVKVLSVDWQRLREVDADARSSVIVDLTPADHAAMYSQPPPRPAVTAESAAGATAPIGSIMTARQTTDLPFPDRSNLAVPRGAAPGPARPGVGVGAGRPGRPATAAMGGVSSLGGPGLARPTAPAAPGSAATTQSLAPFPDPRASLADAVADVQRRAEEANQRATAYGFGKVQAVAAPTGEANSFFSPVSPAHPQESQRMTRMESDLIDAAARGSAPPPVDDLAALVTSSRPQVRSASVDAELSAIASESAKARRDRDVQVYRRIAAVVTAVVVCAVVMRLGVFYYYTSVGYPSTVHAQATEAQREFDELEAQVESGFDAYRTEEEAAITGYRRSQTMAADDVERAVARVQRRIDQRREAADDQIGAARRLLDGRLSELEEQRRAAAGKIATLASLGGGVLALLVALLVIGRAPATKPAAPERSRGRR
ncbi:MAG: hypothetical protein H6697_00255 [Myxococcales bacterium]|nr:hypothetical protein [Myxococcales bacterium]MCB9520060.1 hypothetical protein [Myxococcales bacterium]